MCPIQTHVVETNISEKVGNKCNDEREFKMMFREKPIGMNAKEGRHHVQKVYRIYIFNHWKKLSRTCLPSIASFNLQSGLEKNTQ